MYEGKFAEYWAQAQFCYFKAEAAKGPASKHLWIQMAQDWIALAETLVPQVKQNDDLVDQWDQLDPFIAA